MYKYKFLQAGQLPWEHMSFLQNLLNFITKYLKHEADGDLNIWVDKLAPVASKIGDINIYYQCNMIKRQWRCYPQWRIAPLTSITKLLLLPKFDNSSPSVTQDKEVSHMIMSWWHHYCLRQSTQRKPFNSVYLLSKFNVSMLRTLKT